MSSKILIIAAHPDDEVLGCGGTIARRASKGDDVSLAILGEGITSRSEMREDADKKSLDKLKNQCRNAADLLGVKKVYFSDLPDNSFDSIPMLRIVKVVEDLIKKIKPGIIYTHHWGDLNVDHELTYRAVETATRPVPGQTVKTVYTFEVPSSSNWVFGKQQECMMPNVFIDITSTIDKKIEALDKYVGEARGFPHPRAPEAVRALAQYRGSQSGLNAAEAFYLAREIRE